MSQRDLAHLTAALAAATGGQPGVGATVTALDEAVGRGRGDMRTPLNLESLRAEGLVHQLQDGTWALTDAGIERLREDEELSNQ